MKWRIPEVVVAIASPTAAPEKREERPNLVLCRVYARRRDGFNSTLGVKGKPTQLQLPPNSFFFFSPRREETWSRRRRKKGWMRKVFAARTLRLQKLLQVTLKKHTTDWIQPQKSWFRAEKFIFNAELRTTCPKILRTDTTNTWTVVHPDRSWTKDYKAKKLSGNLVNADFNIWAWRLLVICFVVISRCA